MKYWAVCTVTSKVTYLGDFEDVDEATLANYELKSFFSTAPMNENELKALGSSIEVALHES